MLDEESRQQIVRARVRTALTELGKLFGPRARLTFVARLEGDPDAGLIVSGDNLADVETAIARRREAESA